MPCEGGLFVVLGGFLEPVVATPELTAPPIVEEANPLAGMSRAQRDDWRSDDKAFDYGTRADAPVTKPAESLPAPPVEQAAPTGVTTKTDSEPVNPKTEKRFQEILAQRAAAQERADALERRLREIEGKNPAAKQDAKPESSPARQKFESLDEWRAKNPDKPTDDYLDERQDFNDRQKAAADKQQADYDAFEKTITEQIATYADRVAADVGDVDAFKASLDKHAIFSDLKPTWALPDGVAVKPHNLLATELFKSPIPGKLIEHLRDHQSELLAMLNGDPPQIANAVGRLEGRLMAGQSPATPKEPPKLTTSAPPPPKVVSQRPAEPADPKRAAIDSGDYLAFKALEDAEDAARFARRK